VACYFSFTKYFLQFSWKLALLVNDNLTFPISFVGSLLITQNNPNNNGYFVGRIIVADMGNEKVNLLSGLCALY
jgi:hypothetical protein